MIRNPDEAFVATLEAMSYRLAALERVSGRPGVWTAPTFLNGWTNFGSGWQTARYRREGDLVRIQGLIKTGTINTAAFNLPAGFRPPAGLLEVRLDGAGAGQRMDIMANGNVIPAAGSTAFFSVNATFAVT